MGSCPQRKEAAGIRDISYRNGDSTPTECEGYRSLRIRQEGLKKLGCRPTRKQAAFLIERVPQSRCEGLGLGALGCVWIWVQGRACLVWPHILTTCLYSSWPHLRQLSRVPAATPGLPTQTSHSQSAPLTSQYSIPTKHWDLLP